MRVAVRMVFVVTLSALMVTVLFCSGPYSSAEDRQQTVPALSLWAPGQTEWGCVGLGMTSVTVDFLPQNDVPVGRYTVPAGSVPDSVVTYGPWTVERSGDGYVLTPPDSWQGFGTRAGVFLATYPVDTGTGTLGVSVQWLIGITDLEKLIVN